LEGRLLRVWVASGNSYNECCEKSSIAEFDEHRLMVGSLSQHVYLHIAYARDEVFGNENEIAANRLFGPAVFENACGRSVRPVRMRDRPAVDKCWRSGRCEGLEGELVFRIHLREIEVAVQDR